MTNSPPKPSVLAIVGPTGVGKTAVSLAIAQALPVEIVSADSRQVYRYLDIGTSKPTLQQRRQVAHHLIDVADPDEDYNAGIYGRQARQAVRDIARRDKVPLIVGGSGLYIRALLHGFFQQQIGDPEVREALKQRAAAEGSQSLFVELSRIDPEAAAHIHPNDAQRIVRALEVFQLTGRPLSGWQKDTGQAFEVNALMLGLSMPRGLLGERIEQRVDDMIADGLVQEAQGLIGRGYTPELNALQTVGYREIFAHLDGQCTLAEAVVLIKRNTKRYAKRQMTWFRADASIRWLSREGRDSQQVAEHCVGLFRTWLEQLD